MVDNRKDNHYSVYIHINKVNGKSYVGVTGRYPVKNRWGPNGINYKSQIFYRAIQKYGWDNFEHIIFASNLTIQEAKEMEVTLIKELKSLVAQNGYNVSEGGDANTSLCKKIVQFDLHGNYLKTYDSALSASEICNLHLPNMIDCCKGRSLQSGGYIWRYEVDVDDIKTFKNTLDLSLYERYEPIYQFTLNGEFVREYKNVQEAVLLNKDLYSSSIYDVCRGEYRHTGGYIWKFKKDVSNIQMFIDDPNNFKDKDNKARAKKPVLMFDLDGNYIREFSSSLEAADFLGCWRHTIENCCNGKTRIAYGYLFRYKSEYHGEKISYQKYHPKTKRVAQYDIITGKLIKIFNSTSEAIKALNINRSGIKDCCNGKQKTAYGYKWAYIKN